MKAEPRLAWSRVPVRCASTPALRPRATATATRLGGMSHTKPSSTNNNSSPTETENCSPNDPDATWKRRVHWNALCLWQALLDQTCHCRKRLWALLASEPLFASGRQHNTPTPCWPSMISWERPNGMIMSSPCVVGPSSGRTRPHTESTPGIAREPRRWAHAKLASWRRKQPNRNKPIRPTQGCDNRTQQ